MAEYIDKMEVLNKLQGRKTIELVMNIKPADVVERAEYEKLLKENEELKEIATNCIEADSQSCEELAELHSKIDRAIAEIIEYRDSDANDLCEVEVGDVNDVLRILRRNIED